MQGYRVKRFWNNLSTNAIIFRLGFLTSVISFLDILLLKVRKNFSDWMSYGKKEQLSSISLYQMVQTTSSTYRRATVDTFFLVAVWFLFFSACTFKCKLSSLLWTCIFRRKKKQTTTFIFFFLVLFSVKSVLNRKLQLNLFWWHD